MIGDNEISLNQATMVEAIQHYFSTVLFKDERIPLVKSVEAKNIQGYSGISSDNFTVKVTQRPTEQAQMAERPATDTH